MLAAYEAPDAAQRAVRARMLEFIDAHPRDAHLRSSLEGHLTASALVLDAERERVLLTFHRKLGRWLQLGGHCDGDANLLGVAWREVVEESGVVPRAISAAPVDLDVHEIPARPGEPAHLHLDTRYLVALPPGARVAASEESLELAWFAPDEARGLDLDRSLQRLLDVVFD